MRTRLNLASQPFRNQRLPLVGVALATLLLLAATIGQALQVRELVGRRASELHAEVQRLEAERDALARAAAAARAPEPDKETLARWALLADVVERRRFSWTGLLARLEQVLPADVRLVFVSPGSLDDGVELALHAVARSPEAALGLVAALQGQPDFEAVTPLSQVSRAEGVEIRVTARYRPRPGTAAASPAPEAPATPPDAAGPTEEAP